MRIYIVDKEFIVIRTLKALLCDLGHDVVSFNSVDTLLQNQKKENGFVDVIIIDLNIPKDEGIRIISKIHKKYPRTDIVIMSSILPFQEAILYGVFSYLKKPIHFDELELILARISEKSENPFKNG